MAFVTTTSAVYASSAPVILDLEGNPTCSSLVANDVIFEARDTSVDGGDTLTLSENGQLLTYEVLPDGVTLSWGFPLVQPPDVDLFPVNFVILKGAGNAGARVFHYGADGLTGDSALEGPGTLKTVSFCYGLGGATVGQPDEVTRCDEIPNQAGSVLGVEVACPVDSEAYSIHVIKKGPEFEYDECTCNETATICDKSLPAGTIGSCIPLITDECPVGGSYGGVLDPYPSRDACLQANQLREAPGAIVPWNNGSGWCSSVLGSISCKTW
jgi:hypothetical protein